MAGDERQYGRITVPRGRRVDDEAAAALVSSFRDRFRTRKLADQYMSGTFFRGSEQPSWVAFGQRHRVFRAELPGLAIADDLPVLLYLEFWNPPKLFDTMWRDARDYLLTRHPWEQSEAYVFPPRMEWVVTYTHEFETDMEDLILLSGRVDAILSKDVSAAKGRGT